MFELYLLLHVITITVFHGASRPALQILGSPRILPLKRGKSGGPWLQSVTGVVLIFVTLQSNAN